MNFWTAVVVIVAILSFASIRIAKYRADRSLGDGEIGNQPAARSGRESELEREVADLRERLRVLERITTETNTLEHRQTRAIAEEIEALRDK